MQISPVGKRPPCVHFYPFTLLLPTFFYQNALKSFHAIPLSPQDLSIHPSESAVKIFCITPFKEAIPGRATISQQMSPSSMNNWGKSRIEWVPGAERAFVLICRGLSKKAALAASFAAAGKPAEGIGGAGWGRRAASSAAASASWKNPARDQLGLRRSHRLIKNPKCDCFFCVCVFALSIQTTSRQLLVVQPCNMLMRDSGTVITVQLVGVQWCLNLFS